MKKLLYVVALLFLVVGCDGVMNSPTKRVEEFLNDYQTMDSEVLTQLDEVINNEAMLNDEQKKDYKALMEKQYQNLAYTIKDETVDGNNATVEVEIEVYDYTSAMNKADDYLISNQADFLDDMGNVDNVKFMSYKIAQMKNVKEKTKYTLNLTLTKEDKEWVLNDITEVERQKIHGIYSAQ